MLNACGKMNKVITYKNNCALDSKFKSIYLQLSWEIASQIVITLDIKGIYKHTYLPIMTGYC